MPCKSPQGLKCVRENWVVPPGLASVTVSRPGAEAPGYFQPSLRGLHPLPFLNPALQRPAKFSSPLRGWILELFVPPDRQNVSSHAHTEALGYVRSPLRGLILGRFVPQDCPDNN